MGNFDLKNIIMAIKKIFNRSIKGWLSVKNHFIFYYTLQLINKKFDTIKTYQTNCFCYGGEKGI